jgi:type III secretion protein L
MSSYPTALLHRLNIMPVDFSMELQVGEPQPWFPSDCDLSNRKVEANAATAEMPSMGEAQGPSRQEILAGNEETMQVESEAAFERGRTEALQEQEHELTTVRKRYANAIQNIQNLAQDLAGRYQQEAIELAACLAKTVIGSNLETCPDALQALVDRALQGVDHPKDILIRVNPDDLQALNDHLPEIRRQRGAPISVRATADPKIERGGCVIISEEGIVDAQPSVAVDVMKEAIEARLADRNISSMDNTGAPSQEPDPNPMPEPKSMEELL